MTEPNPNPALGFFTMAMIVVGFLMVALCGSCTAIFAIGSLIDVLQGHGGGGEFPAESVLQAAIVLGGPPTLIGVLLTWGGFRLRRKPRPPRE